MPRLVAIDELHVTVRVPAAAPDYLVRAVVRALAAPAAAARVRRAVRLAVAGVGLPAGSRVSVGR